jgi:thioredoxin 1
VSDDGKRRVASAVAVEAFRDELGFIPHLPGTPEAINADSFDEDVLESPVPVLVEFWAARCAPCRRLAPTLATVAAAWRGRARVFTLNVDEELPAAERFGVRSIPAVLLFVGGTEKARLIGDDLTGEDLRGLLEGSGEQRVESEYAGAEVHGVDFNVCCELQ